MNWLLMKRYNQNPQNRQVIEPSAELVLSTAVTEVKNEAFRSSYGLVGPFKRPRSAFNHSDECYSSLLFHQGEELPCIQIVGRKVGAIAQPHLEINLLVQVPHDFLRRFSSKRVKHTRGPRIRACERNRHGGTIREGMK